MTTRRVHIVDDDPAIRDALKWLLESRNLHATTWDSAQAFLDGPWRELEGCMLLDVRMEGMTGLELFERLKELGFRLPVIFLTGHADVPMAVDALKKGARDFVEKPFNDNDLVDRILSALDADVSERARARARANIEGRLATLSAREREVMEALLMGKMNKVIADELGVTMRTVEVHRARVFDKMGVRGAVELANLMASFRA